LINSINEFTARYHASVNLSSNNNVDVVWENFTLFWWIRPLELLLRKRKPEFADPPTGDHFGPLRLTSSENKEWLSVVRELRRSKRGNLPLKSSLSAFVEQQWLFKRRLGAIEPATATKEMENGGEMAEDPTSSSTFWKYLKREANQDIAHNKATDPIELDAPTAAPVFLGKQMAPLKLAIFFAINMRRFGEITHPKFTLKIVLHERLDRSAE
jgi:hypothetical protein